MKILLKRRKPEVGPNPTHRTVPWLQSVPFALPTMGVLVHRVREVTTYLHDGKRSHDAVHYWCGNGTTHIEFLEHVPDGRIVCQRCEIAAQTAGQPSVDELEGHHVHVGRVRAFRTCCITCCEEDRN